jgi:phage shock protein PspC (stress-responsive transcriptional regulator)
MDTTEIPSDQHLDPATPEQEAPRLRRSRQHRMLAGVARGLAQRYDVDVSLVRVAFVVLAFAWGLGVIVYAAMWAVVPSEPQDDSAPDAPDEPAPSWLSFLLLAGVLAFGLLVVSSWWGGPRFGGLVSVGWLVVLVGLLAVAVTRPSGGRAIRKALGIAALALLTVGLLVTGGFLALVASTGVPMTGGIGDRVYVPASLSQVQPAYRLGAGNLTVDLRRVHFSSQDPVHLAASVAVGMLTIDLPPKVSVDVTAHSGVGNVTSTPDGLWRFTTPTSSGKPQLVLNAQAGVGQVRIVRVPAAA